MDSEHEKLLKDENFMERLVLDITPYVITELKQKKNTIVSMKRFHVDHFQTYET